MRRGSSWRCCPGLNEERPLNLLFVSTFYPPYAFGGDAIATYRLAHALGDEGHWVEVAHCVDSYHMLHPEPPPMAFAEHPRVRRHELRSPLRVLSPLLTQQTGMPVLKAPGLHRLFDSRPWDVVHYHNMSLIGPGALGYSCRLSSPVKLYTTHEHWLVCPMHVLWKYTGEPCTKPDCLRCVVASNRPPQLWRHTKLLDRSSAHVDRFLSPSRFTARMHAERGFPYPMAHLPYFIDRVDGDWREPGPRPHGKPYFLFVGRLEAIKGLQTLIDLWHRHAPPYDLLVAGGGSEERRLRELAGANPAIRFLGTQPQSALGNLYYHALACLVPSITYESFGIINIEAFARKTPVIARNLGALPEVIEESGGGFVYDTDEQLLTAMHSIAESPSLRAELGERGYAAFASKWSREAHLRAYFNLIEEIASRKRGDVPSGVRKEAWQTA